MRFLGLLLSAVFVEIRTILGVVPAAAPAVLDRLGALLPCGLCRTISWCGGRVYAALVLIGLGLAGLFSGTLAKRIRKRKWVEFPMARKSPRTCPS